LKISVIIPVYNVERYLARCLDSVLASAGNSPAETEIICVNDGSTDGSAGILAAYADRVRVLTQANGGLGSARNAGLDVATGDYVLFVDSDDWIPRHALSAFASAAKESNARLVVSLAFAHERENGAVVGLKANAQDRAKVWYRRETPWIAGKKVQYSACNKLYARGLFRARRYPATVYEDFPVTTDVFCEAGSFVAIDEPLYVYCANAGGTSLVRSAFTERKLRDSVDVVRRVVGTARRQVDPRLARFALRQAADGHSSTVGQVWKTGDAEIRDAFLAAHAELLKDCPELKGRLSLKAALRLWRMKRT